MILVSLPCIIRCNRITIMNKLVAYLWLYFFTLNSLNLYLTLSLLILFTKHFLSPSLRFPTDPEIKKRWILAIKRVRLDNRKQIWVPSSTDYVCSMHFKPSDYSSTSVRVRLLPTSVPSVFPHSTEAPTTSHRTIRYLASYAQVPAVIVPKPSEDERSTKLRARMAAVTRDMRNARKRENRLRGTIVSLKQQMLETKEINEELSAKLDAYKGTVG